MFAPIVLPEGSLIRNWRLEKRLGKGGFGITYLATEYAAAESGDELGPALRQVAIKEYFPHGIAWREIGQTVTAAPTVEGAGEAFAVGLNAFHKEAQAIARLDHQNVVQMHVVFRANGTAYFVMPFIRGESLGALLQREGTLPEERARRLILPVLDGLAHAHAQNILHRDLKPDNIMIREDGRPVLIDFGTARTQTADDATRYTRVTELVAYTPGYAALEQYSRSASDNRHGPWTDLYAIGAVLYEAITGGTPPESAQRMVDIGGGQADPLVPVSAQLQDAPGYSRAFLMAIDWALEIAAKDRPQTIAEFRAALVGERMPPEATLRRLERQGAGTEALTVASPEQLLQPSAASARPTSRKATVRPPASAATMQVIAQPQAMTADAAHRKKKAIAGVLGVLALAVALLLFDRFALDRAAPVPATSVPAPMVADDEYIKTVGQGNQAWTFYRQGNIPAFSDALSYFAQAYQQQPERKDAIAGLELVAQEAMRRAQSMTNEATALQTLQQVQRSSPYFAHYEPLVQAIIKLNSPPTPGSHE